MALRDMLNLVSEVSVIKTLSSSDGKGGKTSTTSTVILPLAYIWENSARNWFIAAKYAEDSTHTLVFEYGAYTFGVSATGCTVVETVSFNGDTYRTVGPCNNIANQNEIMVQLLERLK